MRWGTLIFRYGIYKVFWRKIEFVLSQKNQSLGDNANEKRMFQAEETAQAKPRDEVTQSD